MIAEQALADDALVSAFLLVDAAGLFFWGGKFAQWDGQAAPGAVIVPSGGIQTGFGPGRQFVSTAPCMEKKD